MPTITVVKPFLLRPKEDAEMLYYEPGEYDVDDEVANHWYVKAHLEGFVEPPAPVGTFGYAQAKLNAEQAVRRTDLPAMATTQPRAPISAEAIKVASRSTIPEDAHYFAGGPQEDKPMPGHDEAGPRISFITNQPQH